MSAVCTEAGVSTKNFCEAFTDREALLRAVVLHHAEDPRRTRVVMLEVIGVSAAMDRHRRAQIHAFADAIVVAAMGAMPPSPSLQP